MGKNENTKTLSMPYEGLTGYVIEIPSNINLFGQLEFEILKKYGSRKESPAMAFS